MRITQYEGPDGIRIAAERKDGLHPIDRPAGKGLAEMLPELPTVSELETLVLDEPAGEVKLLPPLTPGKIVAIGLNYLDHIRESGVDPPERPLVFSKFPGTVIGTGDTIAFDTGITERVDWEVELGVVIGSRMRNVGQEDALAHVFGYTGVNDVSARDLQFGDGQWTRGKSLDTFCPVGPVVVTADEIDDPQGLSLETSVNGDVVQSSSTSEMVFGVAEILSFCSNNFTLEPGDLVITGTPWGCGEFMDPPRSLADGDLVETTVEKIGTLANPVRTTHKEYA